MPLGPASSDREVYPIGGQWFYRRLDKVQVGPYDTLDQALAGWLDHIKPYLGPQVNAWIKVMSRAIGPLCHQHGPDGEWYFWNQDLKTRSGPYETKADADRAVEAMVLHHGGL